MSDGRHLFERELRNALEHGMASDEGLDDDELRQLGIARRWHRRLREASASIASKEQAAEVAGCFAADIFDAIDKGTDGSIGKARAAAMLSSWSGTDPAVRRLRERAVTNDSEDRERRRDVTRRIKAAASEPRPRVALPAPESPEDREARLEARLEELKDAGSVRQRRRQADQ